MKVSQPNWLPVSNRTYLVLGLSRTGLGACDWIQQLGGKVLAWDDNPLGREAAKSKGITIDDNPDWSIVAAVVQSPGIPLSYNLSQIAASHKIPIISDINLLRFYNDKATYIGITGTNGKSTTTALISHVLEKCGFKVAMGGNIGVSALTLPNLEENGIYVLELSSYQLEIAVKLDLDYAIWTNIQPDHLARHGNMENYVNAKANIFNGLRKTAIIGADDDISTQQAGGYQGERVTFSKNGNSSMFYFEGDKLYVKGASVLDFKAVKSLRGEHNKQNVAAVFALTKEMGLDTKIVADAISTFPGLPHRQEIVALKNGVTFVNDSKATNVDATTTAMEVFKDIFWIAGGQYKGDDMAPLEKYKDRIRAGFFIGESANFFKDFAKRCAIESQVSHDMQTAVNAAYTSAREFAKLGGVPVVLLSPATASFDQFKDFESRGDSFKTAVNSIVSGKDGN